MVDFGKAADGGEVLGRALQDAFELDLRLFELLQLDQRTPERHPRREIPGVYGQAGTADVYGLLKLAGAAVFLGQLREGNRRRVLLDPSSKIFQSLIGCHPRLRRGYHDRIGLLAREPTAIRYRQGDIVRRVHRRCRRRRYHQWIRVRARRR